MQKVVYYLLLTALLFGVVSQSQARIGVGIGTGKIVVDDILKPGQIYTLPSVTVLNTGDQKGNYQIGISYHQDQKELEPKKEWFIFSPQKFELQPGKGQKIEVKLNLPLRMEPGKYFAYVEGSPFAKSKDGATTIGIAAATKLYFTVEPANIFQAIYYKVITFWKEYQPWTSRVTWIVITLLILGLFKKYFNIQINVKK